MKMTHLSVSSAILAAVLSGCSQQQIATGPDAYAAGSQQASGGSQVSSQQQGANQAGSQQQVATPAPVVTPPKKVAKPSPRIKSVIRKPKPAHSITQAKGLPAAKPGQCFARVKVPAKYVTKSRQVLIKAATNKRVLVRAPQYRWVNRNVLVKKAVYKSKVQPAQYKTTYKRVLVKPAYTTWKKGKGAITRIDNMTGEIMCRVTVPAVYKTVEKRVLVHPARTVRTLVPAVYKKVKIKQRIAPALYKTISTPARYRTQNYRVKVSGTRYIWKSVLCQTNAPKKAYRKPVKKQYRKAVVKHKPMARSTAPKKQYRQSGISYQDYIRVMNAGKSSSKLKKKKMSKKIINKKAFNMKAKVPSRLKKTMSQPKKSKNISKSDTRKGIVFGIQKALVAKGYNPGAIDGRLGPDTALALKKFQSSRGLPVGLLSKDTFRALGLIR